MTYLKLSEDLLGFVLRLNRSSFDGIKYLSRIFETSVYVIIVEDLEGINEIVRGVETIIKSLSFTIRK